MVRFTTSAAALAAAQATMDGAFDWKGSCCCRAAARAFNRLWGTHLLTDAAYTSAAQAARYLVRCGGVDAIAMHAGLERAEPMPGLIGPVDIRAPFGWALGLCIEPGLWAVKETSGLMLLRANGTAWGVPQCNSMS